MADVSHYPLAFICYKWIAKEQTIFSHVCFLFCLIFLSVLNTFSVSLTCKNIDLVRKWHHNPDDSTDILFRLTLPVLHFSLNNIKLCNSSSAMAFIFLLNIFKARWSVFTIKVWICWCTFSILSSKHLIIELFPMLSITVGHFVKVKFRVNIKYHKIIIIFYLAHY